jgi:hypothetical protein
MRVNDTDTVACGDMLNDEISEQGRLSRTSLSDDVDMLAGVGRGKTEGSRFPPMVVLPDLDDLVIHDSKANRHSIRSEPPASERGSVRSAPGEPVSRRWQTLWERAGEVMATGLETRWLGKVEVKGFLGSGNWACRVLYSTMREAWRAPDGAGRICRLAAARFSAADLPQRSYRDSETVAASI